MHEREVGWAWRVGDVTSLAVREGHRDKITAPNISAIRRGRWVLRSRSSRTSPRPKPIRHDRRLLAIQASDPTGACPRSPLDEGRHGVSERCDGEIGEGSICVTMNEPKSTITIRASDGRGRDRDLQPLERQAWLKAQHIFLVPSSPR